jgi:hypothetical protein
MLRDEPQQVTHVKMIKVDACDFHVCAKFQ